MQAALVLGQSTQACSWSVLIGGAVAHSLYQQSELRQIAEDKAATETQSGVQEAVNAAVETALKIRKERDANGKRAVKKAVKTETEGARE